MKARIKDKLGFRPFTLEIEIETEDDALVLLHKLNGNNAIDFRRLCSSRRVPDNFDTTLEIWHAINSHLCNCGNKT